MMIRVLALAAALVASQALAADLTVTLNDQQQQIILQALDAYVRADGVKVAGNAVSVLQAMQAGTPKASPPPDKTPPDKAP